MPSDDLENLFDEFRRDIRKRARAEDRERWARGEGLDDPRCPNCRLPMWKNIAGTWWCPDCELPKNITNEQIEAYLNSPEAAWITEGDEDDPAAQPPPRRRIRSKKKPPR